MPKTVTDLDKEIGERIRLRRNELGMSQTALGKAIGVSFQQVQKYERGANRVGGGRLKQVAEALNLRPSDLVDSTDAEAVREQTLGRKASRLLTAFSMLRAPEQNHLLGLAEALARVQDRQVPDEDEADD